MVKRWGTVMVLALCLAGLSGAQNLLTNGSFEDDPPGSFPTGWTALADPGYPAYDQAALEARFKVEDGNRFGWNHIGGDPVDGDQTLQIYTNEEPAIGGYLYQQVADLPAGNYTARAWMYNGSREGAVHWPDYAWSYVGVDPTGGTDPTSPNVIWSSAFSSGVDDWNREGHWFRVHVNFELTSTSTVTYYLRVANQDYIPGIDYFYLQGNSFDHCELLEGTSFPKFVVWSWNAAIRSGDSLSSVGGGYEAGFGWAWAYWQDGTFYLTPNAYHEVIWSEDPEFGTYSTSNPYPGFEPYQEFGGSWLTVDWWWTDESGTNQHTPINNLLPSTSVPYGPNRVYYFKIIVSQTGFEDGEEIITLETPPHIDYSFDLSYDEGNEWVAGTVSWETDIAHYKTTGSEYTIFAKMYWDTADYIDGNNLDPNATGSYRNNTGTVIMSWNGGWVASRDAHNDLALAANTDYYFLFQVQESLNHGGTWRTHGVKIHTPAPPEPPTPALLNGTMGYRDGVYTEVDGMFNSWPDKWRFIAGSGNRRHNFPDANDFYWQYCRDLLLGGIRTSFAFITHGVRMECYLWQVVETIPGEVYTYHSDKGARNPGDPFDPSYVARRGVKTTQFMNPTGMAYPGGIQAAEFAYLDNSWVPINPEIERGMFYDEDGDGWADLVWNPNTEEWVYVYAYHGDTFPAEATGDKMSVWDRATLNEVDDFYFCWVNFTNAHWYGAKQSPEFSSGWNLISVAVEPQPGDDDEDGIDNRDASEVFADLIDAGNVLTNALYKYEGGYKLYPSDFTMVETGVGYWLKLTVPASCRSRGEIYGVHQTLVVNPGWSMIGSPFSYPVPFAEVTVSDGVETKSIADAVAAGWIQVPWFYYVPGAGYKQLKYDGTGDDDHLQPWTGYWVKVYTATPLTLTIPGFGTTWP